MELAVSPCDASVVGPAQQEVSLVVLCSCEGGAEEEDHVLKVVQVDLFVLGAMARADYFY